MLIKINIGECVHPPRLNARAIGTATLSLTISLQYYSVFTKTGISFLKENFSFSFKNGFSK